MQQYDEVEIFTALANIEKIADEIRFFLVSNLEINQLDKISELECIYQKKGVEIDKLICLLGLLKENDVEVSEEISNKINELAVEDKHLLSMVDERRAGIKLKLKNLMTKKKLLLYNKNIARIK